MKLSTVTLATGVLGLAAVNVYLYSALDAERSRANTQAAARHDLQAQIEALHQECVTLEPDAVEGEAWPLNTDAKKGVLGSERNLRTAGDRAGVREFAFTGSEREIPRARHEASLRRLYGGLRDELSLSPEQEAQLLGLLFEQRLEQVDMLRTFAGDGAAMNRAMNELRQESETELMAMLGDKYLPFEGYQKSLHERMRIEQAALQLEAATVPLREEQRKDLLAVMVEERDRIPRPAWTADISAQENAARQRAWEENAEERVRDRATSVLTSDQLKQYDVYRNLQSATRRRQLESWRAARHRALDSRTANRGPT